MLIPIGVDSSERRIPWVTFGLIVLCCIVFGLQQQAIQVNLELLEKAMTPYPSLEFMAPDLAQMLGGFEQTYGFPGRLGGWTAFSYIFLHGNTAHLLGNMLILYLLGSKLEDLWGLVTLLLLFLTGGAMLATHLVRLEGERPRQLKRSRTV